MVREGAFRRERHWRGSHPPEAGYDGGDGRCAGDARPAPHRGSHGRSEIADLLGQELERQRRQIELIASENFTWPAVFEAVGNTPTSKYAELSRQALLRRLRGRRRDRAARDRPREVALRRRARERPAARRRADQHGRLHGGAQAGRHDPVARAVHGGHLTHGLKVNFSGRLYTIVHYGVSRDEHGRLRRRAPAREGAPAESDRVRRVRVPTNGRNRPVPEDRRRGRRTAPLRHGALRRARRRRAPSEPGRALRLRHLDDAQDSRGAPRRVRPLPRGARAGRRPRGLPGDAGRAAPARSRRRRPASGSQPPRRSRTTSGRFARTRTSRTR